jgi:hypothetical protein
MKRFILLVTALTLVGGAIAASGQVREAKAAGPTVVATINGGGTALMTSGPGAGGKSVSSFGFHATLYSDGTAIGHVDCVDHMGDTATGNIFGDVTAWSPGGLWTGELVHHRGGGRDPGRPSLPYQFRCDDSKLRGRGRGATGRWVSQQVPSALNSCSAGRSTSA